VSWILQQIAANVSSSEFTFTFTVGFMVRFRVSFFSQLSTAKADVLKVCGQEWGCKSSVCHITWFSQHPNAASQRGGGEGLRLQSQEVQDLCAAAAAAHLIFKTSTAEQSVDLTNKDMTKDSQRFSPWFHSAWRTTGRWGVLKGSGQSGVESECVDTTYFLRLVHKDSCFEHEQVRDVLQSV
jgi:hypothetical protein